MATLTVQIVSGAGTSVKTLTFSPADATRIISAFQNQNPGGTQDQLAIYFASVLQKQINFLVRLNERTTPTPPVLT